MSNVTKRTDSIIVFSVTIATSGTSFHFPLLSSNLSNTFGKKIQSKITSKINAEMYTNQGACNGLITSTLIKINQTKLLIIHLPFLLSKVYHIYLLPASVQEKLSASSHRSCPILSFTGVVKAFSMLHLESSNLDINVP